MNAIELYQTSELSYREVANRLGINNSSLIANWMKNFRAEGMDGLAKTKGSPTVLSKKEKKKTTKTTPEPRDPIKDLEKQVCSLQIENAFLTEWKKL